MTNPAADDPLRSRLAAVEAELASWRSRARARKERLAWLAFACVALLTLGQVTVQNADLEVHENPDGGAAGSDSYELKLTGRVSGPADRSMILQNLAESGSDDYRLSIQNNSDTELMSVDDDGGLSVGSLTGGSGGSIALVDSDGSGPESVTIEPPTGANLTTSYTLTLPTDDGSDGDFLRTDGSGALSWSGTITQATATSDTTNTSTSYGLLNSMTVTPGAGDYMVWFSCSAESTSSTEVFFALFVGGSEVTHTERRFRAEESIPNTSFGIALQAYVTSVGASDAIEIRWRNGSSGETAECHERTLTVMKR